MADFFARNREFLAPFDPVRGEEFFTVAWWRDQIPQDRAAFREDRGLRLAVFLREAPHRVVGSIGLSNFVRGAFQACHLGFSLDREMQGRGLMREALEAVIDYAFGPLGFHRVMANHLPDNARSEGLLIRLGFEREGYARSYLQIGGRWRDHVLRSRIRPGDWDATG